MTQRRLMFTIHPTFKAEPLLKLDPNAIIFKSDEKDDYSTIFVTENTKLKQIDIMNVVKDRNVVMAGIPSTIAFNVCYYVYYQ